MLSSLVPRLAAVLVGLALIASLGGCASDDAAHSSSQTSQSTASSPPSTRMGGAYTSTEETPMPDVTVETLDGTSIALDEQDGKVLLLNFWATWCAPCRKEIPDLIDLQNELGSEGLTVIGISLDREGESAVRPFMEQHGINYPIVIDTSQELESTFGPLQALPTTLVVNPEGTITRRIIGIFPTEQMRPELEAMLEPSDA